jgi:hypothetical protein
MAVTVGPEPLAAPEPDPELVLFSVDPQAARGRRAAIGSRARVSLMPQ